MIRGRAAILVVPAACAACTFTGLGNYDVRTCGHPVGNTTAVQQVGSIASSDLTFASANGADPLGAFPTEANGGSCVQAVGPAGYIEATCSFFLSQSPQQPWVAPIGAGYAAVAVSTTGGCTSGVLAYQYIAPSSGGSTSLTACVTGAALPALVPLSDGQSALVAWYEASSGSRGEPIQDCQNVQSAPAPLVAAVVSGATSASPSIGKLVTLSLTGASVRPVAMVLPSGQSQVVVAAPDQGAVSLWTLDASLSGTAPTTTISGLTGAMAVSAAVATDGSGRIAVVAEIGCRPQTIALAVGTLEGGFSTTVVAPGGSDAAVQPTVAWVASENDWIVSWISASGGPHALARRFDPDGNPLGRTIDPSTPATGAVVSADGSLFAYVPGSSSFMSASLGCAE